ncbi:hypothetical protein V6N12_028518 [Hibiscus sabdariffa]|uniref:Uncharacterized protein n=1 Tax=Hibiscus sabdariffa TaxID=183260 RepID=A0ABR2F637_9ROSI
MEISCGHESPLPPNFLEFEEDEDINVAIKEHSLSYDGDPSPSNVARNSGKLLPRIHEPLPARSFLPIGSLEINNSTFEKVKVVGHISGDNPENLLPLSKVTSDVEMTDGSSAKVNAPCTDCNLISCSDMTGHVSSTGSEMGESILDMMPVHKMHQSQMVRRKVFSLNLVNDRQEGETIDRGSLETGRGIEWCVWCISRTLNDWWPDGEEETVADNENESGESEEDEVQMVPRRAIRNPHEAFEGYRDGATNWASARVKADYQISSNEALDPNATQAPTPNGQEGTR